VKKGENFNPQSYTFQESIRCPKDKHFNLLEIAKNHVVMEHLHIYIFELYIN